MYAFAACIAFSALLCFPSVSPIIAALCLALIYTAVSLINTSILSIFPINFLSTGQVASVSGIMDFATYLGAGISSAVYGFVITHFGYTPMFVSWAAISIASLCLLGVLNRRQKQKMEAKETQSTNG